MTEASMTESAAKVPTQEQCSNAQYYLRAAAEAALVNNWHDFEPVRIDVLQCFQDAASALGLHVSAQPAVQPQGDLVKLREVAETAIGAEKAFRALPHQTYEHATTNWHNLRNISDLALKDFHNSTTPAVILSLLARIEALEAENASLATIWFEFMKCCEELDAEAEQKITPDNPIAHDTGFWRGQKHATKVIRHSASKAIAAYDTPAKDERRDIKRPDWKAIYEDCAHEDDAHDNDLVTVTRETVELASHALRKQNQNDFYHNYGAAERELMDVLAAHTPAKPDEAVAASIERLTAKLRSIESVTIIGMSSKEIDAPDTPTKDEHGEEAK